MDSEFHHDPFAPEGANAMTDFNTERWDRAGASADELAVLQEEHDALPEPERAAMNGWVASISDGDLRNYLEARRDAEPDGFVAAIADVQATQGGAPPAVAPNGDPSPVAGGGDRTPEPDEDEDPKKGSRSRSGHHGG